MCGICGIKNFNGQEVDQLILQRINDKMTMRGPDDSGYFREQNIGLAMRRLSIIDLDGGHQPIYNEDQTIHVVLNGEIYNYIELREDLVQEARREEMAFFQKMGGCTRGHPSRNAWQRPEKDPSQ